VGNAAKAGSALQAALRRRGCALEADEARALAVALRELIAAGLIGPDPLLPSHLALNHQPHGSLPETTHTCVVGCGTRGGWGRTATPRTPAYNMGSSVGMEES